MNDNKISIQFNKHYHFEQKCDLIFDFSNLFDYNSLDSNERARTLIQPASFKCVKTIDKFDRI